MQSKLVPVLAVLMAADAWAHEIQTSKYTFRKEVRPILEAHCGRCHASGGVAPMSLLRYQEAFPWAAALKIEILEGRMPPWPVEEGGGEFRGAQSLTARELDVLLDWATGGAPEGSSEGAAQPTVAAPQNEDLRPDLVLELPEEVVLPPDELEKEICVPLPTNLRTAQRVSGIQFFPGNPAIVRNATLNVGSQCDKNVRPLMVWAPGAGPWVLPEGVAETLPARSVLALDVRYRKTWRDDGKEARDRSRVAIRFATAPVRDLQALRIDSSPLTLSRDTRMLSVLPVLEKGEPIRVEAIRRDGTRIPILKIASYDPAWRTKLALLRPLLLEKGDRIEAEPPRLWVEYTRR